MNKQTDKQTNIHTNKQTNELTNEWMIKSTNEQTNKWLNEGMNYPEAFGFGSIFHRALLPLNSSWMLLAALKIMSN